MEKTKCDCGCHNREQRGDNFGIVNNTHCIRCDEMTTTKQNIGMLRQWLNENRITDPNKMVTNADIERWLGEGINPPDSAVNN